MLVSGVLVALPFTEPVGVVPEGVDVLVEASVPPALFFADCFAAFSASRFCFDAEGAMLVLVLTSPWSSLVVSRERRVQLRTREEGGARNRIR